MGSMVNSVKRHFITAFIAVQVCFACLTSSFGQTPVITVRFSNPQNDCISEEYCLDVEFLSNLTNVEVFGMNVRFFYDDDVLELVNFRDFQGGYGPVAPDPPIITTSTPAGPALFNFPGPAEFVNGAMQLVNSGAPPIILDTSSWTKLFQICFLVDDPNANLDTFCPSIVWDLEQNPANGGFLSGDDGVVITTVDPDPNNESLPSQEEVVQFNWEYSGNGTPPFGQPVETTCSNINCALPLNLLYFNGYAGPAGNYLDWKTSDASGVKEFSIQRSPDGIFWEQIGTLPSKPNTGHVNTYSFLDQTPGTGKSYYRLVCIDDDGRLSFSGLLAIYSNQPVKESRFSIFPNPVLDGKLNIQPSQPFGPGSTYTLFSSTGIPFLAGPVSESGSILDLHAFPSGTYILSIVTPENSASFKVMIR